MHVLQGMMMLVWAQFDDDGTKWLHFSRYWPFVRGIHWSPVDSHHKGQWRGALMYSFISASANSWASNRYAGNLWHHRAHYDVTVMFTQLRSLKRLCSKQHQCRDARMNVFCHTVTFTNYSQKTSCSNTTVNSSFQILNIHHIVILVIIFITKGQPWRVRLNVSYESITI